MGHGAGGSRHRVAVVPGPLPDFAGVPDVSVASRGHRPVGQDSNSVWNTLLGQTFWMLSPPLAVIVAGSLVYMCTQRQSADTLILTFVGVHLGVFLFYQYHVYYFLPLAPFAAIAAGRGLYAMGARTAWRIVAATTAVALVTIPFSVIMLAGNKYSGVPSDQFAPFLAQKGYTLSKVVLGIDEGRVRELGTAHQAGGRARGRHGSAADRLCRTNRARWGDARRSRSG